MTSIIPQPRFHGIRRGGLFNGHSGPFNRRWKDGPVAPTGDGSLKDVVASTVFDLDATIAASYPGSGQIWANLVTAPADGAAQTAYDFWLGSTSGAAANDPTFNGTAGSAAAYWSFDGADFFRLAGGNTGFINSLHKTTGGVDWWAALTIQIPSLGANSPMIFSTRGTASSSTNGYAYLSTTSGLRLRIGQRGATGLTMSDSSGTFTTDTPIILLASHSLSNNQSRYWISSTTSSEADHTFNASVANAASVLDVGARNGTDPFLATTRLYSLAMGNEYLDNTKAAAIIAALEARHARDYTP
jgi:hypothetical protein